jgi:hypothetical protein
MSDRFDFEQQIQKCWIITDDIGEIAEGVLERDLTSDQVANALVGLQQLYELKFNKLWDLFEDVHMNLVRDEKMAREECAALREQLIAETQGYGGAGNNSKSGAGTRYGQLDPQGFGFPVSKGKNK